MEISLMSYGSRCPKCNQSVMVTWDFVKGFVNCPNCNYSMHIPEDEFCETVENIKQQLSD